MATTTIRQDMPPPGGYNKIQYERIPAKTYFKGKSYETYEAPKFL